MRDRRRGKRLAAAAGGDPAAARGVLESRRRPWRVAVIGPGAAPAGLRRLAREVGFELARRGIVLVCGGLGGCMAAAAEGARRAGGTCIGVLPGTDADAAGNGVDVPLPTGLGEARNAVVVTAADGVLAVGGGAGTLSEIGLALKLRRPIVGLRTWSIRDAGGGRTALLVARSPAGAVRRLLQELEVRH